MVHSLKIPFISKHQIGSIIYLEGQPITNRLEEIFVTIQEETVVIDGSSLK